MAEIVLNLLLPLIGKLGEYLVDPIKNQVSSLCCYSCNVQRLSDEVPKLEVERQTVQQAVDAAKRNLQDIRPDVDDWLARSDDIQITSHRILTDADNIRKRCLSKWFPVLHYSLSREARKIKGAYVELRVTGRFERVYNPANPQDLETIPSTSEISIKSRDSVEKEIMDALKNDSVYLLGLCGMGGIGKTTLVEKIEKRARGKAEDSTAKPMFEVVLMAVVTHQPDLSKIQQEIADELGLTLVETSLRVRARQLHKRLKDAQSVLIILDDVWRRLNLEELGIPSQSTHAGCKLILTSRNRNALTLTEDAKIFSLEALSDEEAWILFKKYIDNSIDSSDLHQIANDVVKECKGLPLALVTVGSALTGLNKSCWKDALLGLQEPIPTNIPEVLEEVYRPLRFSYNQLQSDEYEYLFLVCCLFPEDSDISLEELVSCGKGLGMFAGIQNLMQARNRVERIVENLVNRSLLVKSYRNWEKKWFVKVHDVIRDMGLWIASEGEGKHVFMASHIKNEWPKLKENCTCMSLIVSSEKVFPECINFPRLEFLHMGSGVSWLPLGRLPEYFFSGMQGLKVLFGSSISELPSSIHLLNNLRTLRLRGCRMETTSLIGELISLEILCLQHCVFEVLSKKIGGLKNLMMLEIYYCQELVRIEAGALSGLVRLEELVILESFKHWEAEEKVKETNNASLAELYFLSHLTTLQIEISDPNVIPERIPHWANRLEKYHIILGPSAVAHQIWPFQDPIEAFEYQKAIVMSTSGQVGPLPNWFCDMVGGAEYLKLEGSGCTDVVDRSGRSGYQNLKYLQLDMCDIQYLICALDVGPQRGAIFPVLETLEIINCLRLEEICNCPPPAGSFAALKELVLRQLSGLTCLWMCPNVKLCLSNLKKVEISECGSLLYLFPMSTAESLSGLEILDIRYCQLMGKIFKKEEGGKEITGGKIGFPNLHHLWLTDLPRLGDFCEGVDGIEFPALSLFYISDLASLLGRQFLFGHQMWLVNLPRLSDFCEEIQIDGIEFPALKSLHIADLLSLNREVNLNGQFLLLRLNRRFLFDHQVARNLNFNGLQTLKIQSIHYFRSLFSPSDFTYQTDLKELIVRDCSMLHEVIGDEKIFRLGKTRRVLFRELETLVLSNLPKILAFGRTIGSLELPSLKELIIDDCPKMETFILDFSNVPISRTAIGTSESKCIIQPFFSEEIWFSNLEILRLKNLKTARIFGHDIPIDSFCRLQILEVESCHRIRNVFSPPISRRLTKLKRLEVVNCIELQEVIAKEGEEGQMNIKQILFPLLEILMLENLPKMQNFCHVIDDLELPSLERVTIENCAMLETFSLGPLHLPSSIKVDGLYDHDFATKFFFNFNKEISSDKIHLDNNCFTLSERDLSIDEEIWFLAPHSSGCFFTARESFSRELDVNREFEMVKLQLGVVYEIIFMIKWEELAVKESKATTDKSWKCLINIKLFLPGGVELDHTEMLDEKQTGEWVDIMVGEIVIQDSDQIGQLQFSLRWLFYDIKVLFTKGVVIRPKMNGMHS